MRSAVLPAASVLLLLSGCTSFGGESGGAAAATEADAEQASVTTTSPDELTVVSDATDVALAASTSRALFASSDVAVLARSGDAAGTMLAASAAAGLGVPVLLESADGTDPAAGEELERLGVTTVLRVGEEPAEDAGGDSDVVAVPADPAAVAAAAGLEWADVREVADEDAVAELAGTDEPVALVADGAAAPTGSPEDSLPEVAAAEPLSDTIVLATGAPEELAAVATARAAGARVLVTDGGTDPRALPEVVAAMGEQEPSSVVVLGAGFADEDGLEWKVATAATGVELPAGGQVLFPESFLVALYGHPGTSALGIMGEQPVDAAVQRAREHAASYEALVDATVVPSFEIIATVASEFPGPDGNYSNEAEVDLLRPWVEAAGEAGLYVVLDLQPGRTDFVTQAELYREFLELPHVGLALDPEWRLGPNEVHLTQIGSVPVEEVNRVITWLADLTRENALPQKLLVLHQFRLDMLPGRERLDLSRDELAVMVHADGQGPQGSKQATWRTLRQGAQPELWWGWKNFYDEDSPMLTARQTVEQVDPLPQLISYQ